jgi:DNA-binding transcriptional LysR family regulator
MQARAFLTVARYGRFVHAAQVLHISQPALTVQVQQLEEALHLRLLDRDTRGVTLTPAGRELVPMLQKLILEHETILANARDLAKLNFGTIRMACIPSIATTYLPEAIAQFRELHAKVGFDLHDVNGNRVVEMVRQDEVEFGITNIDQKWPDLDVTALYEEDIHALYPKSHQLASEDQVTLEKLAEYPLILLGTEFHSRSILESAFIAAGRLVRPVCEPKQTSTAIGMVRAGLGIALLGSLVIAASNLPCFPELCSRPIDSPRLKLTINLIRKAGRSLSPAAKTFSDILFEYNEKSRWLDPHWVPGIGASSKIGDLFRSNLLGEGEPTSTRPTGSYSQRHEDPAS